MTRGELREMWRHKNTYMVFRTSNEDVARSALLEATATTNVNFGLDKVCFGDGLLGFDYGKFAVIFRKDQVPLLHGSPPGEHWARSPVETKAEGYADIEDVEQAREEATKPSTGIRLTQETSTPSKSGCCT